jgi:hypothetical protein
MLVCFHICILTVLFQGYIYAGVTLAPFLLLMALSSLSRSASYARDVEVLMRSMVSHVPELEPDVIPEG